MKEIDIFGSQILFRFAGSPTHNTRFGSIFTIAIVAVIFLRLFFIIQEVFLRKSPTVIFQERQVDNPEKFVLNASTMQLAFGMQDGNFEHYINPRVYKYSMNWVHKKTYFDDKGISVTDWITKEIELQPCSLKNFPSDATLKFFSALTYTNMLCIPPLMDVELEGDFPSDDYQYLQLKLSMCTGTDCEPADVLESYLKSANFAMYFSDTYIDPTLKSEPFVPYARDMFWTTSTQLPKEVQWHVRNNYIKSDYGWFAESFDEIHAPQYSYNNVSINPPDFTEYFYNMVIRFEKAKENLYTRRYKNFNSIISEIGGFTQSLLAIGLIICTRLSQLDLNKEIINEAFNFESINASAHYDETGAVPAIDYSDPAAAVGTGAGGGGATHHGGMNLRLNQNSSMHNNPMNRRDEFSQENMLSIHQTAAGAGSKHNSKGGKHHSNNNNNDKNLLRVAKSENTQQPIIPSSDSRSIANYRPTTPSHGNGVAGDTQQNSVLAQSNMDSFNNQQQNSYFMSGLKNKQIRQKQPTTHNNGSQAFPSVIASPTQGFLLPSQNDQQEVLHRNSQSHFPYQNQDLSGTQVRQGSQVHHGDKKFLTYLIQNPGSHSKLGGGDNSFGPQNMHQMHHNPQQQKALSPDHEKLQIQQQKLEEKLEKQKESDFKRLMQKATSSMTMSVLEYVKFFIWPFGMVKQKKKVIDYGIDKLYYHLDVLYVIKKLLEVDKLKRILLDQQQLKLFEYIPKPTIRTNLGEVEHSSDLRMEIDKHYQDNRTELQKAQEAYLAYTSILSKPNTSVIDRNIISLLDSKIINLFGVPPPSKEFNGGESFEKQDSSLMLANNQSNIGATAGGAAATSSFVAPTAAGPGYGQSIIQINSTVKAPHSSTNTFEGQQQIPNSQHQNNQKSMGKGHHQSIQMVQTQQHQQQMILVKDASPTSGYQNNNSNMNIPHQMYNGQNTRQSSQSMSQQQIVESTITTRNATKQRESSPKSAILMLSDEDREANYLSQQQQFITSKLPLYSIADQAPLSPHIDSQRSMFSEIASDEEKNKSVPMEFGMIDSRKVSE